MDHQELRTKDVERFREAFQQRCDMSRLLDLNSRNSSQLNDRHEMIGEGGHFAAWRLREPVSQQQTRQGLMPLVYKRAHSGFGKAGCIGQRHWLEAMRLLEAPLAMVSPFLAGTADSGEACLLMPYGDKPLATASEHWLPVDHRTQELRAALSARGLAWSDLIQGRCWAGIPFIFDWSELRLAQLGIGRPNIGLGG
jgi:hypothetical protein